MEFIQEDITTLHDFGAVDIDCSLAKTAVVVPIAERDLSNSSTRRTLKLVENESVGELVVPVRGSYEAVKSLNDSLGPRASVLWCDAPRVRELVDDLGLDPTGTKGLDVWLGLAVATGEFEHVIIHDADVTSYTTDHLYRLAWPLQHGYEFSKGYYARVENNQLFGRLLRLLWTPLLTAVREMYSSPFITYLSAFRYALAGEFGGDQATLREFSLPHGWGLEVGILAEAFEHAGETGSAQVDLGWHQHDHRSVDGPNGLTNMASAVVGILYHVLQEHDIPIDPSLLVRRYRYHASRMQRQYAADAAFNGLQYDENHETAQIERYLTAVQEPSEPSVIPSLSSVNLAGETVQERASVPTRAIDNSDT